MLSPKRPYLVRALFEWMEKNALTPYLVVNANADNLQAPLQYAKDGSLVLAISYRATKDLMIGDDCISFGARFGGVSQEVWIPMEAVLGIYAKEQPEHGLFFDAQEYAEYHSNATNNTPAAKDTNTSNHLRFV